MENPSQCDRIYDSWNTIPGDRLYGESLANIGARIAEVSPHYEEYRVYKDPQIIMLQEYGTVRYLRPYLT